ncbi:uncharacterized protein LOC126819581 [Patella vulgata]|uniref:uncharacterized protein LOC126819581 n=1 Tax=Patella vulgata TaxID=6465 RepID=UPI00217F6A39|nr:uncharacterized protein LOC126819581 [Patella vulgata]
MAGRQKDAWPRPRQRQPDMSIKDYMEKQLTSLHYTSSDFNLIDKTQGFLLGALILIFLPFLHIGVFYSMIWVPDKPPIDRSSCTCSCFDTIFRGRYEAPGAVSYKHVYFNATKETFKIWIFTVLFVLMTYESIKYLYKLCRVGKVRKTMFVLYLANIYPHYYSWWSFFSYYNEEIFQFYSNHFYFMMTEIIVTVVVLNLCNAESEIASWKILLIITINSMHIMISLSNQFITHVIHGRGQQFQNARNIGLMIPDVLHILIPVFDLYRYSKANRMGITDLFHKEELMLCVMAATFGTLIGFVL